MKTRKENQASLKTAVLLLAAGKSTRMGNINKLSKRFNGTPLLTHCYNEIKHSNVNQLIVVSSKKNYEQAKNLNNPHPNIAVMPFESKGLGNSISNGMKVVNSDIESVVIALSDMPFVSKFHIDLLIKSNKLHNYNGIHRIYDLNNQPGHPVLFNKIFFSDLLSMKTDTDPKFFFSKNKDLVVKTKVADTSPTFDLDTLSDWGSFR